MKRYNPRSSVHHHIHYHHHRHLTSVLFLHVREYFQPSLNEVTIRVPTGRGPGYTARTARRSLMRRQDVTAFRSPVNPLLSPSPFLHITTCPPPGARALSFTFRSLCLPRFVRTLLLCLPRVRVLLVESVLPGFPSPDGSGSGRTVLERAASLCAACASSFRSSPVTPLLLLLWELRAPSDPAIRLPLRAGCIESVASDIRHCGIGFGSWCCFESCDRLPIRWCSDPLEWTSVIVALASAPVGCSESFERLPIRRSGFLWNGHPSSRNRLRLLLLLLLWELRVASDPASPACAGVVVGTRTDVGTCCGFAASDVRHREIGFAARVRDDGALLWLLLLLLIPFRPGNFVDTTRGGRPHPGRTCGAFARGCRTVKWMRMAWVRSLFVFESLRAEPVGSDSTSQRRRLESLEDSSKKAV